ncbi:MAG TPA: hypothetical protein VKQ11_00415 [Candidatus Sulfotelmatobacter sp.]|nr:hypothetical protein [Candidatus Sulfotelmatobacter sp.]
MENPELTGAERQAAHDKWVKQLDIGPAEDHEKFGGLIGAIGKLVHHHGKAVDAQAAQNDLKEAQNRVAQTAPGMGAPAAGSPTPGQAVLPPPGSAMPAVTPPPAQPPAEVSKGVQGAEDAVEGGTGGQSSPVNAAAGAGVAPPVAQAAAAAPASPSPWMSLTERNLATERAKAQQTAEMGLAANKAKVEQNIGLVGPEDFAKLDPFQRAQLRTGAPIQRDYRPVVSKGGERALSEGERAVFPTDFMTGEPLKEGDIVSAVMVNGEPQGFSRITPKTVGGPTTVGPNGQTTVNRVNPYAPPGATPVVGTIPAMLPTTSSTSSTKPVKIGEDAQGNVTYADMTSSSSATKQKVTPKGPINLTPPSGAPKPSGGGGVPKTRTFEGIKSDSALKRDIENQYDAKGAEAMAETTPVIKMVDRAIAMIKADGENSNMPFTRTLQRLGYKYGLATDASKLINNLELGKVIGAARVLKGGSRSYQALELAMQHLPNVTTGSNKLMLEQLQNVRQNLTDVQDAANQFHRKYPGKNAPNTPQTLIPPGAGRIKILSVEPVAQ